MPGERHRQAVEANDSVYSRNSHDKENWTMNKQSVGEKDEFYIKERKLCY